MSFFKTCEDCRKEINSYDYIFCDDCLKKYLKCHVCTVTITKKDDERSHGQQLCRKCFKDMLVCKVCKTPINENEFFHRASMCNECETKEEKTRLEFADKTNTQLESMWQASADMIGLLCMKSWNCPKDEEKKWRKKAEREQERQSRIQAEITKRAK